MPGIDEQLRSAGERWRGEVERRRPSTAPAERRRQPLQWAGWLAGAAGAAVAVAAVFALVTAGDHGENGDSSAKSATSAAASAVLPASAAAGAGGAAGELETGDPCVIELGKIAPGGLISVTHFGVAGRCDTATTTPTDARPRLTTADHRTVVLRPVPATTEAGVLLRVPATAVPGPATLTDGLGHVVRLTVVAR